MGRSGTTTLRWVFGQYRAGHEYDCARVVPLAAQAWNGMVGPSRARWEMRRRALRFGLEVDSAGFLTPFVPQLRDLYPRAQFVVLIRDCFSWLESRVDHWDWARDPTREPYWSAYQDAMFASSAAPPATAADAPLVDRGIPPVGAFLQRWASTYSGLLAAAPADRTLVLRTEAIDDARDALAAFCRVDRSTLEVPGRVNTSQQRKGIVGDVAVDHVRAEADRFCAPVMDQFWGPDWRAFARGGDA